MARPKKEGMDYFPHDTDAVNDEKIEALRSIYGNDGYAFYFILLERIYRTEFAELDISKSILITSLAAKVGVTKELFGDMLRDACELGLFDSDEVEQRQVITSIGIKKRFSEVNKLRERWRKSKENNDIQPVFHEENTIENSEENMRKRGESKVKESKVKENKVSSDTTNCYFRYQEIFGPLGSTDTQVMDSYLNDGMEEKVILEAFERTLRKAENPKFSYAKSILNNWINRGLTTLDLVNQHDPINKKVIPMEKQYREPSYIEPPDLLAGDWK